MINSESIGEVVSILTVHSGEKVIDKIRISLCGKGRRKNDLIEAWESKGIEWCEEYLGNKRIIAVRRGTSEAQLLVRGGESRVFAVQANPSKFFLSYEDFVAFLNDVIPPEDLHIGKVMEVHFAVDYALSIKEVLRGLDYPLKRRWTYYGEGRYQTGLMIGSPGRLLVVYDKCREQKRRTKSRQSFPEPTTRVELRLKVRSKLPRSVYGFPERIEKMYGQNSELWPMSEIKLYSLEYLPEDQIKNFRQSKFERLRAHLDSVGYFRSRKILNKEKFRQTYSRYFKLSEVEERPHLLLRDSLANFLGLNLGL